MLSNDQSRRRRSQANSRNEEWPKKMKVSLAYKFLGVSQAKMTSLINNGVIPYELDPLDHRVKLVKRADLEALLQKRR
jgi:hypothetical protein